MPFERLEPGRVDPESGERLPRHLEKRRAAASGVLGHGTLACPECDAPVPPAGPMSPGDALGCGYCGHAGAVRDFLTMGLPNRPARVTVRLVLPAAVPVA